MNPEVSHHSLSRADGSATYADNLFAILAAVHGPIEVQRRDELPEEAAIEVNIRPVAGVGGPRERWMESVVSAVLRSVLLVHLHPRTLVQITLQVTKTPTLRMRGIARDLSILPALINSAYLGLVDGGLPMQGTVTSTLLTMTGDTIIEEPSERDLASCTAICALSFNQHGDMLLNESAGHFDLETLEKVAEIGKRQCLAAIASFGEDDSMMNGTAENPPWLRKEMVEQVQAGMAWREHT